MLIISKAALAAIKEHLREHGFDAAVRITMMGGSCAGENLRFTLDEAQSDDLRFVFDHVIFLIDRSLSVRCGAIAVDFAAEYDHCPCSGRNGGFSISSERHSFRCCAHSLQTGGAGCWNSCPADCSDRFTEASTEFRQPCFSA